MKSKNSKLVQKIFGKEIIRRAVDNAKNAGIDRIIAVVGYKKEQALWTTNLCTSKFMCIFARKTANNKL